MTMIPFEVLNSYEYYLAVLICKIQLTNHGFTSDIDYVFRESNPSLEMYHPSNAVIFLKTLT